ncbi:LysR family transcriptional regulator [Dactylosporangium sp. NPDC051541]|uniref:LysR family transcriptional regulator n=1 Tax=Dactylosporangium sp. NPDC051541 TaxID=3363977 RepID=UPI0037A858B3
MKTASLDLNLLLALDALLTERHVTRAGQRIGLSQPAMSDALARLRRHFGDELLTRVGNRYELTPLASGLRATSAAAMELIEQTFGAAHEFDPADCDREFVLIASDYATEILGDALITLIRRQAKRARLRMEQLPAEGALGAIIAEARRVDGFLLPRGIAVPGFPGVDLFRDGWVCLAAADNPAIGDALTLETMAGLPWVLHRLTERRNPIVEGARARGYDLDVELVVDCFRLLPELIRGSTRIGVVQRRWFEQRCDPTGLRTLDPPFEAAPVVEALWWHPALTGDASNRWLRSLIVAAARDFATRRTG